MNKRLIIKILGLILIVEALFMVLPVIVSFCYADGGWKYFLITIAGLLAIGIPMFLIKPKNSYFFSRDGFVLVALAWIVMGLAGAVPFCISGLVPDYLNAVFESVSGFTTSGISILENVEVASHSMLFWRSLTHWIGGMGVLVFVLALTPIAGGSSMYIMKAEAPGPSTDKVVPRISSTAKFLYLAYIILTLAEALALIIAKLPVFDSFIISFGTLATGGFSLLNTSLATYTVAQHIIVIIFMFIAGINFSLFFLVVTKKTRKALLDTEFLWYVAIMIISILLVTLNLHFSASSFGSFGEDLRHGAFASVSAMTSTGFASFNYNQWPLFTKGLMILLMFIGASAGSTGGGIKVSRIIILARAVKAYIKEKMHPRSVNTVFFNRQAISESAIKGILMYLAIFCFIFIGSMIVVTTEESMNFGTAFAAVTTAINNNGIEFSHEGALGFANYSWWSRVVFILDMLIGRLEIFPIVILFAGICSPVTGIVKKIKKKI